MNWNDVQLRAIRHDLQRRAIANPMDVPASPLIMAWGARRFGLTLNL